MTLGEGSAAHMIHETLGFVADRIAGPLEAPAEVYLLHMHEVVAFEEDAPECLPDGGSAYYKGRPTGPEDGDRVVVLAFISLHGKAPTPPTGGIPPRVQQPPGPPAYSKYSR